MLILILASVLPTETAIHDQVDLTELNRVYDESGREQLVQVVWWNWSRVDDTYRVVAWRLIEDTGSPRLVGDRWVTQWFDVRGKAFRRVESTMFRKTWLRYDADLEDRKVLPEDKRRGLTTKDKAKW